MFETREQYLECITFIANHDPCLQRCITVLEDYMFFNNPVVSINKKPVTDTFRNFFNKYFMVIAKQVFRYNLLCGFVPWTIIKLKSGENIPRLLPIGSFSWEVKAVERDSKRNKRPNYLKTNNRSASTPSSYDEDGSQNIYIDEPGFLRYVVKPTLSVGLDVQDIIVTSITEPTMLLPGSGQAAPWGTMRFDAANVSFSPLVSAAYSFMRLERAMHRRSYADEWNTTARIVTSNTPKGFTSDMPQSNLLNPLTQPPNSHRTPATGRQGFYSYDDMNVVFMSDETHLHDMLTKNKGHNGAHEPSVYTLPADYHIEKLDQLVPVEDCLRLKKDYEQAVAQIASLPLSLVQNFESNAGLGSGEDPNLMDHLVSQTASRVSKQVEAVMVQMYMRIYHNATETSQPAHEAEARFSVKFKFEPLVDPELPPAGAAAAKKPKKK
jgi:hypothetical protein